MSNSRKISSKSKSGVLKLSLTEDEEVAKEQQNLLLESEFYWKKVPEEFKKILTKHQAVKALVGDDKALEEFAKESSGEGLEELLANQLEAGNLLVSLADPTCLIFYLENRSLKLKVDLKKLYKDLSEQFKKQTKEKYYEEKPTESFSDYDKFMFGLEAGELLNSYYSIPSEEFEQVVYLKHQNFNMFYKFESKKEMKSWVTSFQCLIKCTNKNYRGKSAELPEKVKSFLEEIGVTPKSRLKAIPQNSKLLLFIKDNDQDSEFWRDFKLVFLDSDLETKEKYLVHSNTEKVIKNLNSLSEKVLKLFLKDLRVIEWLKFTHQETNTSGETGERWVFASKNNKHSNSDLEPFWYRRRQIFKSYKSKTINPEKINALIGSSSDTSELENCFKAMQVQKQALRANIHTLATKPPKRKRGTRGGKWRKKKQQKAINQQEQEKLKRAETVLKLLMFSENQELIPEPILPQTGPSRDSCCCLL